MCRVPAIAHGRVLTVHSLSLSALRVGAGPPARLEALMSRPQLAIRVVLIRYEPLGLITIHRADVVVDHRAPSVTDLIHSRCSGRYSTLLVE